MSVLLLGIKITEKNTERQLLLQLKKKSEICNPAYLVQTKECLGRVNLLLAIAEKVVSGQMILTHGSLQCHLLYSIGGSTGNVGRIGWNSGIHLFQSTGIHSHWCSNFAKPNLASPHSPLQEVSETIRRIKEETSIQCFQSSDSNDIVQCFTLP